MNRIFLLGAGASMEAGVPTSILMSDKIAASLNNWRDAWQPLQEEKSRVAQVVNFVSAGLMFEASQKGRNPFESGVDVESLFRVIMLLAEKDDLELSTFISSWHPMVDSLDKQKVKRPDLRDLFERIINKSADEAEVRIGSRIGYFRSSSRARDDAHSLADSLSFALDSTVATGGNGHVFHRTRKWMLDALSKQVWIEDASKVEYLRPLLDDLKKNGRQIIATLNYDNSIELMTAELGVECNVGLDHFSATGKFDFRSAGLHLIKLHGSVNWSSIRNIGSPDRPMPHVSVQLTDAPYRMRTQPQGGFDPYEPAVIFGEKNKLTADGPFLELLRAFQEELNDCLSLVVIGYSFRDHHINKYISDWINGDPKRRLTIIDPSFSQSKVKYVSADLGLLRHFRSDQLEIIEEPAGKGLIAL